MIKNSFKGRVALVTGGSSGIGRATVLKLAEYGADISLCARRKKILEMTANEVIKIGSEALAISADSNNDGEVEYVIKKTVKEFGKIDILINCVGGDGVIKPILDLTIADWQKDLNQSFFGTVRFCNFTIPHMLKNKYGRIVNVSSIAAIRPNPTYIPYCVAKECIITYTKALAKAFSSKDILINTVLPGLVETMQMERVESLLSKKFNVSKQDIHNKFIREIPVGRYAKPEEIAELIIFLSSSQKYITGASYMIDGGMLAEI